MNRKAILTALILSIVVSGALWLRIQRGARDREITVLPPKIATTPLIVARKRIPARTRLEEARLHEFFEIRQINASDAVHFPDAITDIASLANRFTTVPTLKGDVMTAQRVLADDAVPDLAHAIPRGKRAVSIAVSKVTGVGGFIQQGNYVDVIATFEPEAGETLSKIVLQDILVLAVGGMYQLDGAPATTPPAIAAARVDLVTLAVTPEELERLMFLESGVTFRLVLKNPLDKDLETRTAGATARSVLKGLGLPEPGADPLRAAMAAGAPPPAEAAPPGDDGRVEIWYGSPDRRREVFRESHPAGGAPRRIAPPIGIPAPEVVPPFPAIAHPTDE